jgi:hypothetical protein
LALGILAVTAFSLSACLAPVWITDFWWQLKTGEIIVRTGRIPTRDVFGWTSERAPWVVHEWLTEVLFYVVYTHLPQSTLLLYKAGLPTLALLLTGWRIHRRTGRPWLALAVVALTALAIRFFADLRPHVITLLLVTALFFCLDEYRQGRLRWLPWLLPPVFIVWANLHGAVVVGLLLFILWLVGEGLGSVLLGRPTLGWGRLALSALACAAGILITPHHVHIYTYPFWVLGHPHVQDFVQEWRPPGLREPWLRPFEVLLVGGWGALAVAPRTERRSYGDLLVVLALTHASLTAVRHVALFSIVMAPLLGTALADLFDAAAPRFSLVRPPSWLRHASAVLAVVALAVGAYRLLPPVPVQRWFVHATRMDDFPQRAADALAMGKWPGRLHNDYSHGGYLIWRLHPERRVFVDGRAEIYYASGAFDDHRTIHHTQAGWDRLLDKWQVQTVLTARNSNLDRALDAKAGWMRAFRDSVSTIYWREHVPAPARTEP